MRGLLAAMFLGSTSLVGQEPTPDRLPLPEQFRMHYFIDDSIIAALPGYVDFDTDFPCLVVVHLLDTLTWGDSARTLFRYALPADSSALGRQTCGGHPQVQVRAAKYSRVELARFISRIETVLGDSALRVRSSVRFTADTLIVEAPSRAALERARARLAREAGLPQSLLAYRVWDPEEIDGPVRPPAAAYLAVLDTIASAPSEPGRPFVIDTRSLPREISENDLRSVGLRPRSPADTCNKVTVVTFDSPRQYVNGEYGFTLRWRMNDYYYGVRCDSAICRVRRAGQLPGDKIVTGCASAEFGEARHGKLGERP